jgi:hypothetical protein
MTGWLFDSLRLRSGRLCIDRRRNALLTTDQRLAADCLNGNRVFRRYRDGWKLGDRRRNR